MGEADALVALVSIGWIHSNCCQREYQAAENREINIIPVHLGPCPFDDQDIAKRHQGIKTGEKTPNGQDKSVSEIQKARKEGVIAAMAKAIAHRDIVCSRVAHNTTVQAEINRKNAPARRLPVLSPGV